MLQKVGLSVYLQQLLRNPPRKLYRIRLNYAAVRAINKPFKVIQGHRVWYQSKAHNMRIPIVINRNLYHILYRFRKVQNCYIWLPHALAFNLRPFPWDDIRIIFTQRSEMAKVPNGVETLPIISIAWVGCTNVTDIDDRRTCDDIANVR